MQDNYDTDFDSTSNGKFEDEFELPDAPESWTLEDFDDVLGDFDDLLG